MRVEHRPWRAARIVRVSSVDRIFSSVETKRYTKFLVKELENIYNCRITDVTEEFRAAEILETDVSAINLG